MQKIEINVYGFKELSDKSKTKALNNLRYINTDHVWWGFIYEDFVSLCKTIGIEAEADKIYFRGFYSQGDGSAFDASVNVKALIEGITQEKWKEYAPSANLLLYVPIVNGHVFRLIKKDNPCSIKSAARGYYVKVENNYDFVYNKAVNYDNINKELDNVTAWVGKLPEYLTVFSITH